MVGCAGVSDFFRGEINAENIMAAAVGDNSQDVSLSEKFQKRAIEYEKRGEMKSALVCWQVVSSLNPANRYFTDKVIRLKNDYRRLAQQHFTQGEKYYQKQSYQAAQREFLIALRYNPDHEAALDYLKNKMTYGITTRYSIQKGDSLVKIAKTAYKDPAKYFLIAVYNDLDVDKTLVSGKKLELPVLEASLTQPLVDVPNELKEARKAFINKEFEKVLLISDKILAADESNTEAADLKNAALYQLADGLRQQQNYLESLKMYKKVDPRYKGVEKDINEVKALLKKQAEENYRIGVNYFVNEEFDLAIKYWEITLSQDPDHPKAKEDIEKARQLLKKLKEVD